MWNTPQQSFHSCTINHIPYLECSFPNFNVLQMSNKLQFSTLTTRVHIRQAQFTWHVSLLLWFVLVCDGCMQLLEVNLLSPLQWFIIVMCVYGETLNDMLTSKESEIKTVGNFLSTLMDDVSPWHMSTCIHILYIQFLYCVWQLIQPMVNMGTTSKTGIKCMSFSTRRKLHITYGMPIPMSPTGHKIA
jgi:hypothetical protein